MKKIKKFKQLFEDDKFQEDEINLNGHDYELDIKQISRIVAEKISETSEFISIISDIETSMGEINIILEKLLIKDEKIRTFMETIEGDYLEVMDDHMIENQGMMNLCNLSLTYMSQTIDSFDNISANINNLAKLK